MATADPQQLRAELKQWEHDFQAANGRKPDRADIKSSREIAAKYKLYDKLTRKASKKKEDGSKTSSPTGSKRKRDSGVGLVEAATAETPRKMSRFLNNSDSLSGPKPGSLERTSSDPYDPPLSELFSPSVPRRTVVGPTPQRNGRVLGLFDLLSPESARKSTATPSKSRNTALLSSQTPSKRSGDPATGTPSRSRMGPPVGTPSKQDGTTNGILTPSRSRLNTQKEGQQQGADPKSTTTPSVQRSKILDLEETPEFLKRRRSPAFRPSTSTAALGADAAGDDADGLMNISWSPIAVRQPRRPIGRSFSEIVNANRKAEEERHDDDLSILRELEQEAAAGGPKKKQVQRTQSAMEPLGRDIAPRPSIDIPDSQLLGPDGEREVDRSDEDVEDSKGAKPAGKRWKKKGPKRQTRRVNIKPIQTKWQPEPEWNAGVESDHETGGQAQKQDGSDVVPKTQIAGPSPPTEDDDDLDSEYEDADPAAKAVGKANKPTKKAGGTRVKKMSAGAAKKDFKARKVSATAHANYRTLRIKNKNSKAKRGGRFGRRKGF